MFLSSAFNSSEVGDSFAARQKHQIVDLVCQNDAHCCVIEGLPQASCSQARQEGLVCAGH